MRANIRDHIQQLDILTGGGIISQENRIDTIDNPMLVIGVGGTGIDALLRVKYHVNRKFNLEKDDFGREGDKPQNVEYLAFETNKEDITKDYKGITLDPYKEFVQLTNSQIGLILAARKTMPSYYKDWLSPDLTITDGVNGASGRRQAGRLMLFKKIQMITDVLERKIRKLQAGKEHRLVVYILSGISGGTGSGCFLDIAYIIRQIVENIRADAQITGLEMLGYLFTPDVNLSKTDIPVAIRPTIMKNGYAALKELDFWMNAIDRGDVFEQKYSDNFYVRSEQPPFNSCHLISSTNENGVQLENAYDYTLNVTAENITNFMASEKKNSGEDFAIHDHLSNAKTAIDGMPKTYEANYVYSIIGASSANLPIEEITTYVAAEVFKRMESLFDNSPREEEVRRFAAELGIDIETLTKTLNQNIRKPLSGYQDSPEYSFEMIKSGGMHIGNKLESDYLAVLKEDYSIRARDIPRKIFEKFKSNITSYFIDPKYGPLYVHWLINSSNKYDLLKYLRDGINQIDQKLYDINQRELRSLEGKAKGFYAVFANSKFKLLGGERKRIDFIEAEIALYRKKAEVLCLQEIRTTYSELIIRFGEQNDNNYKVVTEVLNYLNELFKRNANILIDGVEKTRKKGSKTYYWNIIEVPEIVRTIQSIMGQRNNESLISAFTKHLLNNMNQWTQDETLDIKNSIASFLSIQFSELINKELEAFLQMVFGEEKKIDQFIGGDIAAKLDKDAVPLFNIKDHGYTFYSHGMVSIPVNSPLIKKGIQSYKEKAVGNNSGNSTFKIHESKIKNRIYWLNVKNGVPLYIYNQLQRYEEEYEKGLAESEAVGRHLRQTEKENWQFLPSPIPEESWERYNNERVKKYNAEVKELFNRAFEFGLIEDKGEGNTNRFEYKVTKLYHDELQSLVQSFEDREELEDLKRFEDKLTEFVQLVLTSSEYIVDRKTIFRSHDIEKAKINFTRSGPVAINLVKDEVDKLEKVYNQLKAVRDKISSIESKLNAVEDQRKVFINMSTLFLQALYTDTIIQRGTLYRYDKDPQEDPWEPFANLMESGKFVEYTIFKNLVNLNQKKLDILKRKVEKRDLEYLENTEALYPKLKAINEKLKNAKLELDYDHNEIENGQIIFMFYQELLKKVSDILQGISVPKA